MYRFDQNTLILPLIYLGKLFLNKNSDRQIITSLIAFCRYMFIDIFISTQNRVSKNNGIL